MQCPTGAYPKAISVATVGVVCHSCELVSLIHFYVHTLWSTVATWHYICMAHPCHNMAVQAAVGQQRVVNYMMSALVALLLAAAAATAAAALVDDTTLLTHVPMIMVRGRPLVVPLSSSLSHSSWRWQTHDAGSGYLPEPNIVNRWAQTQSGGLGEQLACGARAFDARPTVSSNGTVVVSTLGTPHCNLKSLKCSERLRVVTVAPRIRNRVVLVRPLRRRHRGLAGKEPDGAGALARLGLRRHRAYSLSLSSLSEPQATTHRNISDSSGLVVPAFRTAWTTWRRSQRPWARPS